MIFMTLPAKDTHLVHLDHDFDALARHVPT